MKNKRNYNILNAILLIIITFVLSVQLKAQNLETWSYQYDDAGNRISRIKVIPFFKSIDTLEIESTIKTKEISISCYPNPTKKEINIDLKNKVENEKVELVICDVNGINLNKFEFIQSNKIIDLENYPNGTYFLRIDVNNKTEIFKIIKMN